MRDSIVSTGATTLMPNILASPIPCHRLDRIPGQSLTICPELAFTDRFSRTSLGSLDISVKSGLRSSKSYNTRFVRDRTTCCIGYGIDRVLRLDRNWTRFVWRRRSGMSKDFRTMVNTRIVSGRLKTSYDWKEASKRATLSISSFRAPP